MFKKFLYIYVITFILIILFLFFYKAYKEAKPIDDTFLEKYYKYTPETRFFRIGYKGQLKNINGDVFIKSVDSEERKVVSQTDIFEEDIITVKGNSSAELFLMTGIVKIYDDAQLEVIKVDENSLHSQQKVKLNLKQGKLLAAVVREENRELTFNIKTNLLTAGVRGTKFGVIARNNISEVFCYEGIIKVSDNFGNEEFLRKGFKVSCEQGKEMTKPTQFNLGTQLNQNRWFNEKWEDTKKLQENKSRYALVHEKFGRKQFPEVVNPIASYRRSFSSQSLNTIENYFKQMYRRLYGRNWELKYIRDRERLLKEFGEANIEFFTQDPISGAVVQDLKSKFNIDTSKSVSDYADK